MLFYDHKKENLYLAIVMDLFRKFFRNSEKRVYLSKEVCYNRRGKGGYLRIRGAVLQQKTYAFVSGLYESGGIQTGAQCLKRKENVSI